MHNSSFALKVSDLLRNPGKIDYLSFEGLRTDQVPGLSSEGIAVHLRLQWVSDGSVKVTIEELKATIHDICDLSNEEYDRIVAISHKSASYDQSVGVSLDDKVYNDDFPFANEHETINLEDFLVQCIVLETPLVRIKPGNEYLLNNFDSDEEE